MNEEENNSNSFPCNNGEGEGEGEKFMESRAARTRGDQEEFYGKEMKIKRKSKRQLIELRKQQHN